MVPALGVFFAVGATAIGLAAPASAEQQLLPRRVVHTDATRS